MLCWFIRFSSIPGSFRPLQSINDPAGLSLHSRRKCFEFFYRSRRTAWILASAGGRRLVMTSGRNGISDLVGPQLVACRHRRKDRRELAERKPGGDAHSRTGAERTECERMQLHQ